MKRSAALIAALLFALAVSLRAADLPDYAPAPPDNPLKGFAPYMRQARDFPHSLEFSYLPLNAVMKGADAFDWQPLEEIVAEIASAGRHAVFRFYLEYPNKPLAVPQFLVDAGVTIHTNIVTEGGSKERMLTPDYEDPRLRAALGRFIVALGARYDGDVRIGFITAGLLGKWGEWHDHPSHKLWASKAVQREVMDAYAKAFKKTPVLFRYPAGDNDPMYAANHTRPFGYHDDSFVWATVPTGRKADDWFFFPRMQRAGPDALNKWRTHPIGGEVRPEVWRDLWYEPSSAPAGQEFLRCVEETHATWLMDSSIARPLTPKERDRAIAGARRLGYEFYIASKTVSHDAAKHEFSVSVTVRNFGVAPFYADWPVQLGVQNAQGNIAAVWTPSWKLIGLLPQDPDRHWDFSGDTGKLAPGDYLLLMRVRSNQLNAPPLRFANRSQDQDRNGWLTLGKFTR